MSSDINKEYVNSLELLIEDHELRTASLEKEIELLNSKLDSYVYTLDDVVDQLFTFKVTQIDNINNNVEVDLSYIDDIMEVLTDTLDQEEYEDE